MATKRKPFIVTIERRTIVTEKVLVRAKDAANARVRAEQGKFLAVLSSETEPALDPLATRAVSYTGPRFVKEQEPGDDEYWNVIDVTGRKDCTLAISLEEANDIIAEGGDYEPK